MACRDEDDDDEEEEEEEDDEDDDDDDDDDGVEGECDEENEEEGMSFGEEASSVLLLSEHNINQSTNRYRRQGGYVMPGICLSVCWQLCIKTT